MARFIRVGGSVRDEYLHQVSHDTDYAVEAPSYEAMKEAILQRGMTIFLEKKDWATIRAKDYISKETNDYVLCRKESYRQTSDGLPGTIEEDLGWRDFTINSMGKTEEGQLIDPYGGLKDLKDRIIRCTRSLDRLKEDPVRMARALRFLTTMGYQDFRLNRELEQALHDPAYINLVDPNNERIRQELDKCFQYDPYTAMSVLVKFPDLSQRLLSNWHFKIVPKVLKAGNKAKAEET